MEAYIIRDIKILYYPEIHTPKKEGLTGQISVINTVANIEGELLI